MNTPNPKKFAKVLLWHLAGLRADVAEVHMRLNRIEMRIPPIPASEMTVQNSKMRDELYLEALKAVGGLDDDLTPPASERS